MKEYNFGSLSSRHLMLRFWSPFSWRKSLSVKALWHTVTRRDNWRFSCVRHIGANHRCYCLCGSIIDGRLVLTGFGVSWFYSHYTGDVPCACDESYKQIFRESKATQ